MPVKVLVVEDNPVARAFLSRVVRESFSDDIVIVEARGLESARQHLQIGSVAKPQEGGLFKLILADLELPDGNGQELVAMLADYPATKIVTTLYSDDDHLFPALQNGADGYLLKEDRFEVLVEELQKIVRGQPPLSPAIARRVLSLFRTTPEGNLASGFSNSRPGALDDPSASRSEPLSIRENEVLTHLSKGFTIKEIANLMGIKWFMVNGHIQAIYKKLKTAKRVSAEP